MQYFYSTHFTNIGILCELSNNSSVFLKCHIFSVIFINLIELGRKKGIEIVGLDLSTTKIEPRRKGPRVHSLMLYYLCFSPEN